MALFRANSFIVSRKPRKAVCFNIRRAPCRIAQAYQITPKAAGFSDVPQFETDRDSLQ